MKRRDWIKVRKDWWESPSHRLISPGARYFGVYLLYLADSDPEWRETGVGRLLAPDGSPLCSHDVARMSGSSSRNVARWISELKRVGTLDESDCGALSFPTYRNHQENRSSKYRRGSDGDAVIQHDYSKDAAEKKKQKQSAEGEVDNTPQPPSGVVPPPEKKRKPRKKPRGSYGVDPASVEDADLVLGWIAQARQLCGISARTQSATFANRCYVNVPMVLLEATTDDWAKVIRRQAVKEQSNPEMARRYLTLSTLCRPDNFSRMLERDDLD